MTSSHTPHNTIYDVSIDSEMQQLRLPLFSADDFFAELEQEMLQAVAESFPFVAGNDNLPRLCDVKAGQQSRRPTAAEMESELSLDDLFTPRHFIGRQQGESTHDLSAVRETPSAPY